MYIVTIDKDSPEYLEHFGVLGMHWGVRNAETQRKYNGGQEHSEARTDIAKPTEGHSYQGQFKPSLSKDQTKMLKRAAAGVAIGAGLAAGVAVGMKSGALKTVAKHGAKKLAESKHLQQKGQEFAKRVRTNAVKSVKTQEGRNELKRRALTKKTDISAFTKHKKNVLQSRLVKALLKKQKPEKPVETAAERKLRLKMEKRARKRTNNRILLGVTGAALLSAPVIEGHSVDSRELRRKNGRHASTKWIRNKERLGS